MSELFDDEELLSLDQNSLLAENTSVTVLGKTFSNDEERREYFRKELRKKLPELKKLEGYPIGEDDGYTVNNLLTISLLLICRKQ